MVEKDWIKVLCLNILVFLLFAQWTQGQNTSGNVIGQSSDLDYSNDKINTITTAVPFLLIAPDTRSGGMGDAGAATSADINSIHWNPAKLGLAGLNEKDKRYMGFSLSYTPWLRALVNDISLSYLSGYYHMKDKRSTIGGSLRYFTLGNIQFTDEFGTETQQFSPNEFALDVAYSYKMSDHLYGGTAFRYINSNLTGGVTVQGSESKTGRAVAVDLSIYYENNELELGDKTGEFAFGAVISNIGNKMSYTSTSRTDFIPINLRLGPRFTYHMDEANEISITVDINKLLVPTPPIYKTDSTGNIVENPATGDLEILTGKDPNRAVANGMFGSFTDAPGTPVKDANGNYVYNSDGSVQIEKGSRLREEMREITYSIGVEYWYDKQFAIRSGYFWEHELKGNRKYFTLGAGVKYSVFGLDFSYLIPAYIGNQSTANANSPLDKTLRFTLSFELKENEKGSDVKTD